MTAICQHCGEPFRAKRSTARFCSKAHKTAFSRRLSATATKPPTPPYLRGVKAPPQPIENIKGRVTLRRPSSIPHDRFHPDPKMAAKAIEKAAATRRVLSDELAWILGRRLARDAIGTAW